MRNRPGGRGASRERGLTSTEIALLRPALDLAMAVARDEEPPPRPLRPLVNFAKLPPHALATVRRAVDTDDGFRARVAEVAGSLETQLGRPSWLWLVRPDGWEAELAGLSESALADEASNREEQEERTARRRLGAAVDAKERAERVAAEARALAARLDEELVAERKARRAADTRVVVLEEEATSSRRAWTRLSRRSPL